MKNFKGYFYILYNADDLPAAVIENLEDLRRFLGAKDREQAKYKLYHYMNGKVKTISDNNGRKYSAVKIEG